MSIETLKNALGFDVANCHTCQNLYHETDGEYGEIDCGHHCSKDHLKTNLRSFPFKKEQKCWVPNFWGSNLAKKINGEEENDNMVCKEFHAIVDLHLDAP